MSDNLYQILEIPTDADERQIKTAYHRLAREFHPDKAASPEEAKVVEEQFALVSAAYNTLKDPEKRAEYDRRAKQDESRQTGPSQPRPAPARPATATAAVLAAGRGVPPAAPSQPGAARPAAAPRAAASQAGRPQLGLTPEKAAIAQKAFARGMQFFKENNFIKAIEFFEAAIQNNDTEAVYFTRLSIALIQTRKSATRAIDAAQRAIELEPYNLEYKFNLASVFEAIGSKSNAKRIYEEILRWDQGNSRALAALEAHKKGKSIFSFMGDPPAPVEKPGLLQSLFGRFKK